MELILVTGMSGAGKSVAVNALEDIGYFCVDNIPANLAAKFVELCTSSQSSFSRVAIVVDIRSKEQHQDLCDCLMELEQKKKEAENRVAFALQAGKYEDAKKYCQELEMVIDAISGK